MASQLLKYDKYDKTNDRAATLFLLDSLDTDLCDDIDEMLSGTEPFPVVWLHFIQAIQSTSVERFDQLKSKIKAVRPSQFAGQNLREMAKEYHRLAGELTSAGQYDHNLTLVMVKSFLLAGGDGNEDFRFELRGLKQKLNSALLEIGFKDKAAADAHMLANGLTYKDICKQAQDIYKIFYDRNEWPPAQTPADSTAPPKSFANLSHPNANTLSPSVSSSPASSGHGACHNCGETGHWHRDCPRLKSASRPSSSSGCRSFPRSNGGCSSGGQGAARGARRGWKFVGPKEGEPTTKMMNDRLFKWCAKCARWTTTHDTSTHVGNTNQAKSQATIDQKMEAGIS